MTIKDSIIEAQTAIINNLALCEDTIAALYATYASAIPTMAGFWRELSKKERVHADLLRSMHKQLANGHIFQNIGRFDPASIEAFLSKLNTAISRATHAAISEEEGIETALGIESSVLDAHFYDIVRSDAPEYRFIADRLSTDTHSHVQLVRDKLLEIQTHKPGSSEAR